MKMYAAHGMLVDEQYDSPCAATECGCSAGLGGMFAQSAVLCWEIVQLAAQRQKKAQFSERKFEQCRLNCHIAQVCCKSGSASALATGG